MATILSLPYEILSSVLEEVAHFNAREIQQYTYGVDSTSTTRKAQRIVRGPLAPDALRWLSASAIRCVNSQWHNWACDYALRDLYIRRWRGSERWIQSRKFHAIQDPPSRDVVYRDPYCSLRETANLVSNHPPLASSVRRLFFDGFYGIETSALIFRVLRRCHILDCVTLPWTTLRYGSDEDWSSLLRSRENGTTLSSLGLQAVDLKRAQIEDQVRHMDKKPLNSLNVNFGHLRRIKLLGSSNLMPVNDDDLIAISRTARLEEVHITGTTSITTRGLLAIIRASKDTLRLLEHSPLSDDGFEHPDASLADDASHLCQEIVQCPRLSSLAISLPTICSELFSEASINWSGDVQIRAAGVCGQSGNIRTSAEARRAFFVILSQARSLIENAQQEKDGELSIEIYIEHLIFEPSKDLVHGDFSVGGLLSDGSWPSMQMPSSKGPHGQTGQYGKEERPYTCISLTEFFDGLSQ
ncbi:MAG: hypothetical protein Q9181_001249, partial [Wetmoreana brouardii]